MSNERNALTELSERMRFHKAIAETGYALDGNASKDLAVVSRILAELAKVGYLKTFDGELVAHPGDACEAVDKCREIAEEGVRG